MDDPIGVGRSAHITPLTPGKKSDDDKIAMGFSGLAPGRTYYYRTFVYYNNSSYYYGEVKSFETKSMVNAVTSCSMADIQSGSSIFALTVTPSNFPDYDNNDADVEDATVGVFYSKNRSHLTSLDVITANSERGDRDVYYRMDQVSYAHDYDRKTINDHYKYPLRLQASQLDSGTTYYFRTFTAVNGAIVMGDIVNFTTLN